VESVISTDAKENATDQLDIIIRREEENQLVLLPIANLSGNTTAQVIPENITTCKNNLEQERSTMVQSSNNLF
jgi:hypothetical protein